MDCLNQIYTISFSAEWQSGHAADCKSVYAGSIPTRASNALINNCYVSISYVDMSAATP